MPHPYPPPSPWGELVAVPLPKEELLKILDENAARARQQLTKEFFGGDEKACQDWVSDQINKRRAGRNLPPLD